MSAADWNSYFMSMVFFVAMKSKDPSTKIGAVIVGPDHEIRSTGFNGLPRGMDDTKLHRFERPIKYFYFEHGERNAIYNAARTGIQTAGCTMYTNGLPCADCARAVVQAGIKRVVIDSKWDRSDNAKWQESCAHSAEIFSEAGVEVSQFCGPYMTDIVGHKNGEPYDLKVRG